MLVNVQTFIVYGAEYLHSCENWHILNAEDGPIYLQNSQARGRHQRSRRCAKARTSTLGPNNAARLTFVTFTPKWAAKWATDPIGYANKGHDGHGNSVIGEWCNLGADTNTSNPKNHPGEGLSHVAGPLQTLAKLSAAY
jgi:hypothetical protein